MAAEGIAALPPCAACRLEEGRFGCGSHRVKETVVVEASHWVEDNQWILDLAANEKSIVGFIGNLDPTGAGFSANLQRFAANPLFRGIRWRGDLVQVDATKEHVKRGTKELSDHGLVLELNGKPSMLAEERRSPVDCPICAS